MVEETGPHFLSEAEALVPYLNWKKAMEVPWHECVRDPSRQQSLTPDLVNFYSNNRLLRMAFLEMMTDIAAERVVSFQDFRNRFAQLHKTLILGSEGNTIYMKPDQQVKIGKRAAIDIAGNFGNTPQEWDPKLKDLHFRLTDFLDSDNMNLTKVERVHQIGMVFFYPLNGYAPQFAFGNNSLNMNIVNGLLRLSGLNGIPHSALDIEFMVQINKARFPETFMRHVQESNGFNVK